MGVKVREKASGSGVRLVFIAHQGRRTSRKVGTEEAAAKVAKQIEARLTLGKAALPEKKAPAPTVEEDYGTFRENYLRSATRPSTQRSYESNFRAHFLPSSAACDSTR